MILFGSMKVKRLILVEKECFEECMDKKREIFWSMECISGVKWRVNGKKKRNTKCIG